MCHFITATLPENIDQGRVAAIFKRHKLSFKVLDNPHLSSQLRPRELHVLTTRGSCDCGTELGSLNRFTTSEPTNHKYAAEKFRQQGWSPAKIQRWVEEKGRTRQKRLREAEARTDIGNPRAAQWVALISDLLQSGQTQRIGLLLHLYRGRLNRERIKLIDRKEIKLSGLSSELLMQMQEDVIYEFVV